MRQSKKTDKAHQKAQEKTRWQQDMKSLTHRNGEGFYDPTAGEAIKEADRPTEQVIWFVKTVKRLAEIVDLEVTGRIQVKDKKTGKEYK